MTDANLPGSITVVPAPTRDRLGERELQDYTDYRQKFIAWVCHLGKNPDEAEGYADETARVRCTRIDQFHRSVWEDAGYTTAITHEHADDFMKELAYSDLAQDTKAGHQKALKMFFRWRAFEYGEDEWEPDITFSNDSSTTTPRDYLTREERTKIREAALQYGAIPSYNALSPKERDRWKAHLAQRFEKPKGEVTPDDFARANSWKYPSLFWCALDGGLRPVEVGRAAVHWVDTQNKVLRIPKDESSKNTENWIVSLTERTAAALDRWLTERGQYEKYEDTDAIWLTRHGNRYESQSLNYVLDRLREEAGIDRDLTFYAIRHSVGTYMSREEGIAAAQQQLRHKSPETTMRYDQTPVEDRRDALDRMG